VVVKRAGKSASKTLVIVGRRHSCRNRSNGSLLGCDN